MKIDRMAVRVVAFGWLGTLMDEQIGMQACLSEYLGDDRGQIDQYELANRWKEETYRLYSGSNFYHWPELVARALATASRSVGLRGEMPVPRDLRRWVNRWPLHPEHSALGRLGRRYNVAILSQLDRTSLSGLVPVLARTPDYKITSDLARAYKPSSRYFKLLRVQLDLREPEELLVISSEPELDLEPARAEGFQTLFVDRDGDDDDDEPTSLAEAIALLS